MTCRRSWSKCRKEHIRSKARAGAFCGGSFRDDRTDARKRPPNSRLGEANDEREGALKVPRWAKASQDIN